MHAVALIDVSRLNVPLPTSRGCDLVDAAEVGELVRRFYFDVAQDGLLGPIFNNVAHIDWGVHVPLEATFWCRMLFGQRGYDGNPLRAHQRIHELSPFRAEHFERWLELFLEAVDIGWAGPNADRVKRVACNVARVHSGQLAGVEVDVDPTVGVQ